MRTYILSYDNKGMPVGRQGQRFLSKPALIDKLNMMRTKPEQYTNIKVEERKVWTEQDMNTEIMLQAAKDSLDTYMKENPDEAHDTER